MVNWTTDDDFINTNLTTSVDDGGGNATVGEDIQTGIVNWFLHILIAFILAILILVTAIGESIFLDIISFLSFLFACQLGWWWPVYAPPLDSIDTQPPADEQSSMWMTLEGSGQDVFLIPFFFYLMFYFLPLTKKEAMQRSIYTAFADTHTFGLIERVHMRPPLFYFFFLASQQWPSEQSL